MAADIPKEEIRRELKQMLEQQRGSILAMMREADECFRASIGNNNSNAKLEDWASSQAKDLANLDADMVQFHRFIDEA
jgi:hypothetical protein